VKSTETTLIPPWRRNPRRLVVVLAPLVLLLAAWWLPEVDPNARLEMRAGRAEALAAARQVAVELGLPQVLGDEATAVVKLAEESSNRRARYLRSRIQEAPEDAALAARLAPPVMALVTLRSAAGDQLRVTVGPEAQVVGFQLQQVEAGSSVLRGFSADPEAVAREALRARWGSALYDRLDLDRPDRSSRRDSEANPGDEDPGDPEEGEDTEVEGSEAVERSGGADRVEWTRHLEGVPALTLRFEVLVREGRVVRESVAAELDEEVEESLGRGGGLALLILGWVGASVFAIFAFAYGLWRYVDRLQESEVSHGRTALLGVGVGMMACLALYAYTVTNVGSLQESGIGLSLPVFLGLVFALFFLVGLFLGVVWAGCEGDVRELYGDKLVSLDALLGGRFISRNVARAVLGGLAVGAWIVFFRVLALLPWSESATAGPALAGMSFYVLHPWQHAGSKMFIFLMLFAPLGFLVPLSVIRRWTRSRLRTLPVLAVTSWVAFWLNPATSLRTVPTVAGMTEAVAWALGFALAFLAFDVLTALLSYGSAVFLLQGLYFLHQPAPSLLVDAGWTAVMMAGLAAAAVLMRRYGSEVTAEEVRPGYARNMLERVALSAELSAARQAQGRMLPQRPPAVNGATLTSCCPPEWESEGDYFDFFPLTGGRLGVAVAEFGRAGLATALRMTLAKGFLLSYSWQEREPAETVERLLRQLETLVVEDSHWEVAMAYGCLDPGQRRFTLARAPRSPLVALLPAEGGEPRLLAGAEALEDRPAGVSTLTLDLNPGDRLVFANVEGVNWGAARDRARDRWMEVLRRERVRSADELLQAVRKWGLSVGTVLLLVAEEPAAGRRPSGGAAREQTRNGSEAAA
jgi:MFS family permease